MNDLQGRLHRCMFAVFPDLAESQVANASVESLKAWDSVAAATLIASIEEEFGIEFDVDTVGNLTSYAAIEKALKQAAGN